MDFTTMTTNVAGEWNASHLTTKIQKWLNEANREINNFTNWEYMIEAGVALPVLTGATTASLSALTVPFDSPRLLSITESITPNGLGIYTSYKAFKDAIPVVDDVGVPTAVAIKGDTLYFNKELDQNITFTLDYLKKTTTLSGATDTPEAPADFHDLIQLGAKWRLEKYLGVREWQLTRQEYQSGIMEMKKKLVSARPSGIPKVQISSTLAARRANRFL